MYVLSLDYFIVCPTLMFVNKDNMKAWLIHHGVSANVVAEVIVIDVVFPESFKWIFMVHKKNGDKTHETFKFL
jgi:hypothetical protein